MIDDVTHSPPPPAVTNTLPTGVVVTGFVDNGVGEIMLHPLPYSTTALTHPPLPAPPPRGGGGVVWEAGLGGKWGRRRLRWCGISHFAYRGPKMSFFTFHHSRGGRLVPKVSGGPSLSRWHPSQEPTPNPPQPYPTAV